jgi:YcaO-like protein with predicted kinase domain
MQQDGGAVEVGTDNLWQALEAEQEIPRYRFGTYRTVAPEATLRRLRPFLSQAGITRLADVTGLDWIGLPVYQAIRPNSRNVSVSQGKGLTHAQAQVSALMESLEGFHAEEIQQAGQNATIGAMRATLGYDPASLPVVQTAESALLARDLDYDPYAPSVGQPSYLDDEVMVAWVAATDLETGERRWVPRQLCELNYCIAERLQLPLFRASSNGLASGNTIGEALVHGLCEVIERDAVWRQPTARQDPTRCIHLDSISSGLARRLLARFQRADMQTRVVDIRSPTGLPCFEVFLEHLESPARYYGLGCHPSRTTALIRALTEAAQSRLGHIAGSRDDLYRRSYGGAVLPPADDTDRAAPNTAGDFAQTPTLPLQGLALTLREIVSRVRALTGVAPLAVDLRRPEFNLPVVFVVAPGLRLVPPSRR